MSQDRATINAALEHFVTILCDGAYDTEGAVGRPVRFLSRPVGPFIDRFNSDEDFAAEMVAKAISDGLDDGLLVIWWGFDGEENNSLKRMSLLLDLSRIVGPTQGERLVEHLDAVLLKLEHEDGVERLSDTDARCLRHVVEHKRTWVATSRALPKRKAAALEGRGLLIDDCDGRYGVTNRACVSLDAHDEMMAVLGGSAG